MRGEITREVVPRVLKHPGHAAGSWHGDESRLRAYHRKLREAVSDGRRVCLESTGEYLMSLSK